MSEMWGALLLGWFILSGLVAWGLSAWLRYQRSLDDRE